MEQTIAKLEGLLSTLEGSGQNVAKDLRSEMKDIKSGKLAGLTSIVSKLERQLAPSSENTSESLTEFENILAGPLSRFQSLSSQIGGDVAPQAALVVSAFEAQFEFLKTAAASKKPNSGDTEKLLRPTAELIASIQQHKETNRRSEMFHHLSALSESIPALGWVRVAPTPAPFVKEMKDAGMFYTNRVLKDWKEKDRKHVDWVKAWVESLAELQQFVKKYHTTGLVWNPRGGEASLSVGKTAATTPGPSPVVASPPKPKPAPTKPAKVFGSGGGGGGTPSLRQEGKKWIVEFFSGDSNIKIDDVKMNQSVYIYKCEKSAVQISGKCNNVIIDSCKKTGVICESLVSSFEVMNSSGVQLQVKGTVPTIMVDKTDGCQIFLSKESLETEIVTAKSSEMNVCIPSGEDYTEMALPEQFKTVIRGGSLLTNPTESV